MSGRDTGALIRIGSEPQQVLPLFREELVQQDMSEASGRVPLYACSSAPATGS